MSVDAIVIGNRFAILEPSDRRRWIAVGGALEHHLRIALGAHSRCERRSNYARRTNDAQLSARHLTGTVVVARFAQVLASIR